MDAIVDTVMKSTSDSAVSNTRSWKDFVDLINGIWRKGAADYIACGQYLIEAKDELQLQRDAYSAMLKKLHFNPSVAKKLICIAKTATLSSHVNCLPPCYSTLYYLSQLSESVLEAAFAEGSIHPGMSRADAIALRKPAGAQPEGAQPATNTPSPISKLGASWKACSVEERQDFFNQLGRAGICEAMSSTLLASLRDHVINLNIAGASKATPFAVGCTDKLHVALRCAEQPDPSAEDIRHMVAALGIIIKKAEAGGIARSNIVIAEGKPKKQK